MAKISRDDLIHLSSNDIKLVYKAETYQNLPSPIKEYIEGGKEKFTMGRRFNRVEKILNSIVLERFLTDTL